MDIVLLKIVESFKETQRKIFHKVKNRLKRVSSLILDAETTTSHNHQTINLTSYNKVLTQM